MTLRIACAMFLLAFIALADDIPCQLSNYRVVSSTKVAIDCTQKLTSISGAASVSVVVNGSVSGPPVSTGTLLAAEFKFLVVNLQTPLQGGTDYEMKLTGIAGTANVAFDPAFFRFSTKQSATLAPPIRQTPTNYRYGGELWIDSPVELDVSSAGQLQFSSEDAPGIFVPHRATVFIEPRNAATSFASYGTARLTFDENDEPKQLNSRLKVTGLKNIFGQEIVIKLKKRIAPASSPKGKDDSVYYSRFLHQAGFNSKPAFILDGKVAPVFAITKWKNIQLRPTATADIGQGGAIGQTKTNDQVQFGLGLGRFIRTEHLGPIQGVDPTLGFVYETNYALVHKNALFAGEAQWSPEPTIP